MYDECCDMHSWEHHESWKICLIYNHNISVQDEMRWDPLGSHDQGNQARNGFVHQTVVLVEKAVLAEKSARWG